MCFRSSTILLLKQHWIWQFGFSAFKLQSVSKTHSLLVQPWKHVKEAVFHLLVSQGREHPTPPEDKAPTEGEHRHHGGGIRNSSRAALRSNGNVSHFLTATTPGIPGLQMSWVLSYSVTVSILFLFLGSPHGCRSGICAPESPFLPMRTAPSQTTSLPSLFYT